VSNNLRSRRASAWQNKKKNKAASNKRQAKRMKKIRSKHNNLLNYFIYDKQDLAPGYIRSCEKFFKEASIELQAPSVKQKKILTPTKSLI